MNKTSNATVFLKRLILNSSYGFPPEPPSQLEYNHALKTKITEEGTEIIKQLNIKLNNERI